MLALAQGHWQQRLSVAPGSTLSQVIAQSQLLLRHPQLDPWEYGVAIFGRRCLRDEQVNAGDRLEILRPLIFEPMESRRRRAAHRALKQAKK